MTQTNLRHTALEVDSVSLVLGDGDQQVTALNEVSLAVGAGTLCAVMGPSGAGKSSLLAVCGGLLPPTSGRITIEGHDMTALKEDERARLRRERVGFIFQQSNLVAALTAMDQLLLMSHINGRKLDRSARERAGQLLEEVGLKHRAGHRPHQMSGGERQRVGIARALMNDPSVLLVDEPTSMLDHGRGREVVGLLAKQTREYGVATLMVAHGPEDDFDNELDLPVIESLAEQVRAATGISEVRAINLQDDAIPPVREGNVRQLKRWMQQAQRKGKKLIVVSPASSADGLQHHIRQDLIGLDYTFNEKGLSQHPNFTEWVVTTVQQQVAEL